MYGNRRRVTRGGGKEACDEKCRKYNWKKELPPAGLEQHLRPAAGLRGAEQQRARPVQREPVHNLLHRGVEL